MSASMKSSVVTYGVSLLLTYSGTWPWMAVRLLSQGRICQSLTVELDEPLSRFWKLAERPTPKRLSSVA
jgi:hypothetical protein